MYYELDRNQFARVTVPTKLFDPKDSAFALVPGRRAATVTQGPELSGAALDVERVEVD